MKRRNCAYGNPGSSLFSYCGKGRKYYKSSGCASHHAAYTKPPEQSKEFNQGLMIQADGNSDHGAVVKLMDTARNTGITSISITEI